MFKKLRTLLAGKISLQTDSHFESTDKFIGFLTDSGFILGVFNINKHPTWKYMLDHPFEEAETKFIRGISSQIEQFIDVGAHIGYYTCLVAEHSKASIFSFEPNPSNLLNLCTNIKVNRYKSVKVFEVGLGDKKQKKDFYGEDAGGTIVLDVFPSKPKVSIKINIDKLDNYMRHFDRRKRTLLKIDVEGNEYNVLLGAKKFFESINPDVILIEIVKYWGKNVNPNFLKTHQLLVKYNYTAFVFSNNQLVITNNIEDCVEGSFVYMKNTSLRKYPLNNLTHSTK